MEHLLRSFHCLACGHLRAGQLGANPVADIIVNRFTLSPAPTTDLAVILAQCPLRNTFCGLRAKPPTAAVGNRLVRRRSLEPLGEDLLPRRIQREGEVGGC